ncbi:shikimate dehydrogenase [Aurantimonas sp. 22II-16-19i]|uniref:shikimate dehydrogenase n=1 Tax=Aurantimonas sp. 22II-16-19i TaxID=1317114 RepID=UPI0009F7A5D4|nr:shikimate dehydrogenase [Aurantimonas sp. 22II-16-19i]ORE92097.1 shikimate 5-dehydrogenase [Aurantimonas sp. 22II-16-19i]
MADRNGEWTPKPYVSGAERPRGKGSIFDPDSGTAKPDGPRAFITGWPVWHSRSPLIHATWLKAFELPGSYVRKGVPPEEIGEFFATLKDQGFVGGNVTIPHKVAAFEDVVRRDGDAEAIGAVNTLWFEGDDLVGGNTDAYGFATNLDERLAGWDAAETAVVLGAGGAARAVVHALLTRGVGRVEIVNRTPSRAEDLAARFDAAHPGRVFGHGEEARDARLAGADLLVNTAPIPPRDEETPGWFPETLPDLSALKDDALVTDIVYSPLMTPTLRAAEARGLAFADGLGMLLHQAVPGFERWFGRRPAVDEALRARLVADIESGL